MENLKIETEITEEHQARLTVEIETERLNQAKRRAARIISRRTKIPGFRPGKAPYAIVSRHVGDGAVLEEALDLLIDDLYPEVLEQSEIKPYGPGRLEDLPSTDPPTFTFMVPLSPEVELGDYQKIRRPYELSPTTEDDVAAVLERLREDQAIIEPVERPAEVGDIVYLQLNAKEKDAAEDATSLLKDQQINLLVRSEDDEKLDAEWPFPGFSQHLIGRSPDDEISLEYDFPDEEKYEEFRGKHVAFQASIDEVKSRVLPDLDDELAQTAGDYETLEALKTDVLERLESNARQSYNEAYDDEILDELVESSTIRFPLLMVEHETEHIKRRLQNQLAMQGLDLDVYLKSREMSEEELAEELRPDAERRIRRGLVILNLAEAENIEVHRSDIEEELNQTVAQLAQLRGDDGALSDEEVEDLAERLMGDRMTQMAVERLRAIARGEDDEPAGDDERSAAAEDEPIDEPSPETPSASDSEDAPESPAEADSAEEAEAPKAKEPETS